MESNAPSDSGPGVGRVGLPSPSAYFILFFLLYLYFMTDANYEDKQTCASLQLEEWEVLEVRPTIEHRRKDWLMRTMQSIYPDCVSSDPSKGVKSLEIPIESGEERTVIVVEDETMGSTSLTEDHQTARSEPQALSLSSLPPVLLQFILPETYPMSSPPSIMSLHATNSWLARANQLQKMLEEMWQPGEGVLYTWVEWLRNADFLGTLDLLSEDNTGREFVRCVTLTETIVRHQLLTIRA